MKFAVVSSSHSRQMMPETAAQLVRDIEEHGGSVIGPEEGETRYFAEGAGRMAAERLEDVLVVAGVDDTPESVSSCLGVSAEELRRSGTVVTKEFIADWKREGNAANAKDFVVFSRSGRKRRRSSASSLNGDDSPSRKRRRNAPSSPPLPPPSPPGFLPLGSASVSAFPTALTTVPHEHPRRWHIIPAAAGWGGELWVWASEGVEGRERIAAFDLDGTLVAGREGEEWLHESVPRKLREWYDEGYRIVVFSNQGGVEKGHVPGPAVKDRLQRVGERLFEEHRVPVTVYAAPAYDYCRKPSVGMWHALCALHNGGVAVDHAGSFFVGDAAGRAKDGARKGDFSGDDVKFARNIGVTFRTAESVFLGSRLARDTDSAFWDKGSGAFDPRTSLPPPGSSPVLRQSLSTHARTTLGWSLFDAASAPTDLRRLGSPEVVLLVGAPAAGKSTFARRFFHVDEEAGDGEERAYVHINQDKLKSKAKCIAAARKALEEGNSVVIDAQNRDSSTRKTWENLAVELGVPLRAVNFRLPKPLCFHLNALRRGLPGRWARRAFEAGASEDEEEGAENRFAGVLSDTHAVPAMVIHGFFKNGSFVRLPGSEPAAASGEGAAGGGGGGGGGGRQMSLSRFFGRGGGGGQRGEREGGESRVWTAVPSVGVEEEEDTEGKYAEVMDVRFVPGPFQRVWEETIAMQSLV